MIFRRELLAFHPAKSFSSFGVTSASVVSPTTISVESFGRSQASWNLARSSRVILLPRFPRSRSLSADFHTDASRHTAAPAIRATPFAPEYFSRDRWRQAASFCWRLKSASGKTDLGSRPQTVPAKDRASSSPPKRNGGQSRLLDPQDPHPRIAFHR